MAILELESKYESKKLDKSIVKMRRWKFKKQLKDISEIKATKVSNEIKYHMMEVLSRNDIKIYALVLNKRRIYSFKTFPPKGVNDIYMDITSDFISKIPINEPIDFELDRFLPIGAENIFKSKLIDNIGKYGTISKISFVSSESSKGIQFADLIAWCIFQSFENKNNIFIDIIKRKISIEIYKK